MQGAVGIPYLCNVTGNSSDFFYGQLRFTAPDKVSLLYISLYDHHCSILADNTKISQVIENVQLIFSSPFEVV